MPRKRARKARGSEVSPAPPPDEPQVAAERPLPPWLQWLTAVDRIIERHPKRIAIGLVLAICCVVFRDFLLLKRLYLFLDTGGDTVNIYYPQLFHVADYIRAEGFPQWSFQRGMGQILFPGGIFSPFSLLVLAAGPAAAAYAIGYVEILKIVVATALIVAYLRVIRLSGYTSVLGAVLFAFLGYFTLGTAWYAHSTGVVQFAFLLLAFELMFVKGRWYFLPFAFFFIAGPRITFQSVFLFLYVTYRVICTPNQGLKAYVLTMLKIAGLGTIGLMMAAPQFYSMAAKILQSPRVSGTVAHFDKLSDVPLFRWAAGRELFTALMRLFSNDLMGTGSDFSGWRNYLEAPAFYCGLLSLVLLPQIFLTGARRRRLAAGAFLAIWTVIVLFPHFRYAFYLYAGNYYKHAISLFVPFTILLLSLTALEDCLQRCRKWQLIGAGITAAALVVALYLPPQRKIEIDRPLQALTALLIVVHAGLFCLLNQPRYKYVVRGVLLLVVCVEATWFTNVTVNRRVTLSTADFKSRTGYNDYTLEAIAYLKSIDPGFYRVVKDYSSSPYTKDFSINDAQVQGYYGTTCYSSFNQKYYIAFLQAVDLVSKTDETRTRWAEGVRRGPFIQSLCSVKYRLQRDGKSGAPWVPLTHQKIATFEDIEVHQYDDFLPLGFAYDSFLREDEWAAVADMNLRQIAMLKGCVLDDETAAKMPGLIELQTVGLADPKKYNTADLQADVELLKVNTLRDVRHSQNQISGKISLSSPRLLFFSIPYDVGWSAWVDGQRQTLERVNIGFMGLLLQPGEHTVELRYHVPLLGPLLGVSACGLLLYTGLVVWDRRRRRAPAADPPAPTAG